MTRKPRKDSCLFGLRDEIVAAAVREQRAFSAGSVEGLLRPHLGGARPSERGAEHWEVSPPQLSRLIRCYGELMDLANMARKGIADDPTGPAWTAQASLPNVPEEEQEALVRLIQHDFPAMGAETFVRRHAQSVGVMHRAVTFWLVNVRDGLRQALGPAAIRSE